MLSRALLFVCVSAAPLAAQRTGLDSRRPFEISDNSFLVEEAFNQEAGIFQNILLFQWPNSREWSLEFTQEWPVGSQRHQFSYTIPVERVVDGVDADIRRGTIALNYRYQLTTEESWFAATSPRMSFLFPDAPEDDRHFGLQFNLPLSKQFANLYVHANAGLTIDGISSDAGADTRPHVAGSLIYRLLPMVHLMFESVYRVNEHDLPTGNNDSWVISPGVRAGWNLGDKQLVLGIAVPIGVLHDGETQNLLAYLSYELPFMRR
ncbi:MAG TPA: hypothetical protein VGD49_07715 [Longimicrobiales bacterium]